METMEKTERFNQLKKLAVSVISYWSILPVPVEEKVNFMPLIHYANAEFMNDVPEPREDFLKLVETECNRLEKLVSDMILRKKSKLAQIYQMTHLEPPSAGQGPSDVSVAFQLIMDQISIAKACSLKRQDIVTRVEVLQRARHEIEWYLNGDFNVNCPEDHHRVATGKMLLDFFPKMIEDLEAKVTNWKDGNFSFDGVDVREKVQALKDFYADAVDNVPEDLEDIVHEDPEAGVADMVPGGLEVGDIDIHQLVVPRQARTPRIQVQVNMQPPPPQPHVPPPPPPQPSDGDDSMASNESKSDSRDLDYDPSGSDDTA